MTAPTTPEQAREIANSVLPRLQESSDALRSLAQQVTELAHEVDATQLAFEHWRDECVTLTKERDELRRKFNEADLMAQCTTLLRADLIEAGVVDASVPPMMLTEAVMARVGVLKADALSADHVDVTLNMVPMTEEQISDAYKKATGQYLRPCDKHAVEMMTREIEAHHGIEVKP